MKAFQLAAELMKNPGVEVVLKHGNDWCEVGSIWPTGVHSNAVTLAIMHQTPDGAGDGVRVLPPDLPPVLGE